MPDAAKLTRPTQSLVSVTFVGPAVISPVERATARSLWKAINANDQKVEDVKGSMVKMEEKLDKVMALIEAMQQNEDS